MKALDGKNPSASKENGYPKQPPPVTYLMPRKWHNTKRWPGHFEGWLVSKPNCPKRIRPRCLTSPFLSQTQPFPDSVRCTSYRHVPPNIPKGGIPTPGIAMAFKCQPIQRLVGSCRNSPSWSLMKASNMALTEKLRSSACSDSNPSSSGQATRNKRQAVSPRQRPMPKDLASYYWPKNIGCAVTETISCHPT